MNDLIEISWYGKAGNGIVTASGAMASVLATEGRYVQSMVEYSLQRKGFPIRAFNRISKNPIRNHSYVELPDFIAVTDATLLLHTDIASEMAEDTVFFINSSSAPPHIRNRVDLRDRPVHVLDADKISREELGFAMPGIPMLALMVKYLELISPTAFKEKVRAFLSIKLSRDIIEKNMSVIDRALNEESEE